jgi:hypothetical protein
MSKLHRYGLIGILAAGCGSVVSGPYAADGGSAYEAGVSQDSTADAVDAALPCTSSPLDAGATCTPGVARCEHGTSEFLVCDTYGQCDDGVWSVQGPNTMLCAADTSVCQGAAPVMGTPCTEAAASAPGCDTADGLWCYCYRDAPTLTWMCTAHGPGCPLSRPRLGAPCTFDANAQCSYAGVDIIVCAAGVWVMRVPE